MKLCEIKQLTTSVWGFDIPFSNSKPFPSYWVTRSTFYKMNEDWADASNFDTDEHPSFDPKHAKEMGTYDNHSIWITAYKSGERAVGIVKDGKTLAYLCFDTKLVKINNVDYSKTVKAWTSPDNRKQGLQISIHAFLLEKLHVPIISDDKFSQAGLGLLKQIVNNHRFNVKFYNAKSHEVVTEQPSNLFTPPNDWQVLLNTNKANECSNLFADGRKWDGGHILSEMTLYTDGKWD